MSVDVVIPAHNEGATITNIIHAISATPGIGQIIVVADSCNDDTGVKALYSGSTVLPVHWKNKGSAMASGLDVVRTNNVCFVDGDLVGLEPHHVEELINTGDRDCQVAGLFAWNSLTRWAPPITGQRCVPTWLAQAANLHGTGWQAEHRINAMVGRYGLPWRHFLLEGVQHTSKIGKRNPRGWADTMMQVGIAGFSYGHDLINYTLNPGGRSMEYLPIKDHL